MHMYKFQIFKLGCKIQFLIRYQIKMVLSSTNQKATLRRRGSQQENIFRKLFYSHILHYLTNKQTKLYLLLNFSKLEFPPVPKILFLLLFPVPSPSARPSAQFLKCLQFQNQKSIIQTDASQLKLQHLPLSYFGQSLTF